MSYGFNLSPLDYAIIAMPIVVAIIVTIYVQRYTRSVADYLAAGRTAGRYLIATARMEMGISAAAVVGSMEVFSKTGFSLNIWGSFTGFCLFLVAMSGVITYRFRETRSMTFHQFFEVRFSKRLRVFVTIINVISSMFTMGIGPLVTAQFFVYFLGMSPVTHVGSLAVPTFALIMIAITTASLYFAFAGGQLTIMTTDAIEGVISSILYLVVAFSILALFSYKQMGEALSTGTPGMSYLDPFDISKRPDFNYGFIILGWAMTIYYWRGNAWNAGFAASAKNAHEGQMAVVLGTWRGMASSAMGGLIGLGAFTLMHNPAFAEHAESIRTALLHSIGDGDAQMRTRLLLPTALGVLLPAGVKGALCAVLLMGVIAGGAAGLHGFSAGLVQDMVLPLVKRQMEPRRQVLVLRLTALAIAIYTVVFGLFFHIPDYLVMVTQLMSAIYLAGVGAVVWGGLYWRRSTTQGAWASITAGAVLSSGTMILQQFWSRLAPGLAHMIGPGSLANSILADTSKMPVNSQILSASIMGICLALFVVVSLLTCRQPYDLDKLLHRGRYQMPGEEKVAMAKGFKLSRLAGINENFTPGDRRLAYFTLFWGLTPTFINLLVVIWNISFGRWTLGQWWAWFYFWNVGIPIVGGVLTSIWFTWGVSRDLRSLFRDLRVEQIDASDDGQVHGSAVPSGSEDVSEGAAAVEAKG